MRLLPGFLLLAGLVWLSLFTGVITVSPATLWHDAQARDLVMISRLPRTLAAVLAGAALAVSGQIIQVLARNRFVDPMTAGAGQSAALGVLLATWLIPGAAIWAKMGIAAMTTLLGSAGLMILIRPLPPTQPLLVPLVALVYGGVIGSVVTFFAYQGDMMQFLQVWLTGELSGVLRGRYELLWAAGAVTVATWIIADRITLLSLGDAAGRSLGLNVAAVTAAGLAAVSLVAAMVVVTLGAIPFVGLVVPNIVARMRGDNLRSGLTLSALIGAILVLTADLLGRMLRAPFEIPVATMTGVIGAALFLGFLNAGRRNGRRYD